MNKLRILTALLIICNHAKAQYTPLLDNHNEWQFTTCYFGCVTSTYFVQDDTLVGNYTYKILEGFHYINRNLLLREDTDSRKVYLMTIPEIGVPKEVLLYDFSMEIGDSIELFNSSSPFVSEPGYFTLDSIQLQPLVDGNDYRHFYLSANNPSLAETPNAIWIEGVGARTLISAPGSYPDINQVGQLSCFFKNTNLFYSNTDSIPGCIIAYPELTVSEVTSTNCKLYPTLSNDFITLESSVVIGDLKIIRIDGALSYSAQPNVKKIDLAISGYQNGMYYVVINQGQASEQRMKFIKRD